MIQTRTQSTLAFRCAARNLSSNLAALQPHLIAVLQTIELPVEWVFGRDGSLTARDAGDRWISGCSVPLLAAREMLTRLDVRGAVACFLAPTHAAQLRAALAKLKREQAIVAIVPEAADLRLMLGCENFRREIESHRLWFVTTDHWEDQLLNLFAEEPGLAPPSQFIRLPVTSDDLVGELIPAAQEVFSKVIQHRSAAMRETAALAWSPPPSTRLCVVAPTQFHLWNDIGGVLTSAARQAGDWTLFDADDPACSSPLGLVGVARQCSILLTANTARCDLPGAIPTQLPWITWAAAGRIPSFGAAASGDQLIVLTGDAKRHAIEGGWPQVRVHIGGWPTVLTARTGEPAGPVAVVVDTLPLEQPDHLKDFSSHSLLWDGIRNELLRDPCALGNSPEAYLRSRMRRLDLADDGFPLALFLNHLILPAWQQGWAKLLIDEGVSLRIYGQNWQEIDEFSPHASGPVESPDHLSEILQQTRALIQSWQSANHQAEASGVGIVETFGRTREQVLLSARASVVPKGTNEPPLDGNLLQKILAKTRD